MNGSINKVIIPYIKPVSEPIKGPYKNAIIKIGTILPRVILPP